jgi:hypothetical protein
MQRVLGALQSHFKPLARHILPREQAPKAAVIPWRMSAFGEVVISVQGVRVWIGHLQSQLLATTAAPGPRLAVACGTCRSVEPPARTVKLPRGTREPADANSQPGMTNQQPGQDT